MKKLAFVLIIFLLSASTVWMSDSKGGLKVFISVDMEGIASVVWSKECGPSGRDYDYFREIMTLETNAAIEGALEAGACEIVVRDGHGSKTNILPRLLHKKAKLLRGITKNPENMMLGIDKTFDAVIFIGYHAKAGTKEGVIAHTSSGNVIDLSINGISMPEAGYNALIAGLYDVPVVFVSGDNWICQQVKDLFGEVATFETKFGMGTAELGLHPELVRDKIRTEAAKALNNLKRFKPYKLEPPYTMVLKVKKERGLYPGAKKTRKGEFTYTNSDLLKVMDAFNEMK
ncbi:MAG: M55 family metallopeptidase [Candidatus Aminicenantaceae bacterium]